MCKFSWSCDSGLNRLLQGRMMNARKKESRKEGREGRERERKGRRKEVGRVEGRELSIKLGSFVFSFRCYP